MNLHPGQPGLVNVCSPREIVNSTSARAGHIAHATHGSQGRTPIAEHTLRRAASNKPRAGLPDGANAQSIKPAGGTKGEWGGQGTGVQMDFGHGGG